MTTDNTGNSRDLKAHGAMLLAMPQWMHAVAAAPIFTGVWLVVNREQEHQSHNGQ